MASTLTLDQLRINDSGIIVCIAMVTVFREDSQDVTPMMFTNFTATSLVVLGKYYKQNHTIIKQQTKVPSISSILYIRILSINYKI